jgi:hypothetical protein
MANIRIDQLPIAAAVATTDVVPIVSGGVTKQVSFGGIMTSPSLFGPNVSAFLVNPTSANLRTALTDETGSGAAVFAQGPTLTSATLNSPTLASATINNSTLTSPILTGPVGAGGASYGAAGQVLTSTGVGTSPTWQNVAASGAPDFVLQSYGLV